MSVQSCSYFDKETPFDIYKKTKKTGIFCHCMVRTVVGTKNPQNWLNNDENIFSQIIHNGREIVIV